MSVLGSVFLGDAQRPRILSSPSSPPSSPSRNSTVSPSNSTIDTMIASVSPPPTFLPPPKIDPELSLELRVRWLEALLLGVKEDAKIARSGGKNGISTTDKDTLIKQAEGIQRRLDKIVANNEGLRKFMEQCKCTMPSPSSIQCISYVDDQHAQYLNPSFAVSGTSAAPSYSLLSSEEFDALLTEMEPEIKAADRDMREIEELEKKGVLGAGKLPG